MAVPQSLERSTTKCLVSRKKSRHSPASQLLNAPKFTSVLSTDGVGPMLHTTLHAAGFLLDPEYVELAQNTNEEVMTGCYQLVEQIFSTAEERVSIASQLSQFRSGHGIFGTETEKTSARALPAYQWWQNFGTSVQNYRT